MKTHTRTYPDVSINAHTHFDLLAIFDCWKETQNGTAVTQNWNCPWSTRTERTWPLAKRSPLMCWNSSRQCYECNKGTPRNGVHSCPKESALVLASGQLTFVLDLLNSFYVSDSPIGSLIYHNLPFGEPTLNIRVYIYIHTLQHTIYIHIYIYTHVIYIYIHYIYIILYYKIVFL